MLHRDVVLTPAQQEAWRKLVQEVPGGGVFVLWGAAGMGKTTILNELQAAIGGVLLNSSEFLVELGWRHPLAIEESFLDAVRRGLAQSNLVMVDDLHLVYNVVGNGCGTYPRNGLIEAPAESLMAEAAAAGKTLVFATTGGTPDAIARRAYSWGIPAYQPKDYACVCRAWLDPEPARAMDYAKIHRFAHRLSAAQLKRACLWLSAHGATSTAGMIDYLRSSGLASNVHLGEVQKVDLAQLQGIDDLVRSLEANVVLPLENDALAEEFDLKPKRGILLAGPPGTGKTTVGRALAHRLKSKFFLIDGTFIAGTAGFYNGIANVFEAARQNAPSIIFIDDTDVIFEEGEEYGLYRYLLTMLDGLESESGGRVCVIMTAMDVGSLPPALVRSGRIELWLETRMPDELARAAILKDHLGGLNGHLKGADPERLAAHADGLTGADLKRVVEDGKVLLAYDKARGNDLREAGEYFLSAIETVRANKRCYEDAVRRARERLKGKVEQT
jgi:transitional endoplasmic reticulum ATPase